MQQIVFEMNFKPIHYYSFDLLNVASVNIISHFSQCSCVYRSIFPHILEHRRNSEKYLNLKSWVPLFSVRPTKGFEYIESFSLGVECFVH